MKRGWNGLRWSGGRAIRRHAFLALDRVRPERFCGHIRVEWYPTQPLHYASPGFRREEPRDSFQIGRDLMIRDEEMERENI